MATGRLFGTAASDRDPSRVAPLQTLRSAGTHIMVGCTPVVAMRLKDCCPGAEVIAAICEGAERSARSQLLRSGAGTCQHMRRGCACALAAARVRHRCRALAQLQRRAPSASVARRRSGCRAALLPLLLSYCGRARRAEGAAWRAAAGRPHQPPRAGAPWQAGEVRGGAGGREEGGSPAGIRR